MDYFDDEGSPEETGRTVGYIHRRDPSTGIVHIEEAEFVPTARRAPEGFTADPSYMVDSRRSSDSGRLSSQQEFFMGRKMSGLQEGTRVPARHMSLQDNHVRSRLPAARHGSMPVNRHGSMPVNRHGSMPVNRHGSVPVNRRHMSV